MRRATLLLLVVLGAPSSIAAAPASMQVTATAYCQSGTTKSGTPARTGIVAGDPHVLPVGTVLRLVDGPLSGIYTVMDTGSAIKGRKIDIFIPDCARAIKFGLQRLRVRILRLGWNPKASVADDAGAER